MHFSSYVLWRIKRARLKALFQQPLTNFNTQELLNKQIKKISLFICFNSFPNSISKALLHYLGSNVRNRDVINEINNTKENVTEIFFRLLYVGLKGEQLVKHCLMKILWNKENFILL